MEKIGTFKIDKNMCSNCRENEDCPQKYSINGNCLYIEKDLVKEQVPTNWEELKEMALKFPKRKNSILIELRKYIDNGMEFLCIRRGRYEICQITHNRIRFYSLDMPIDICHAWLIIKGIMEEK